MQQPVQKKQNEQQPVQKNHVRQVEQLLTSRLEDVNTARYSGLTALGVAVFSERIDLIEKLIEAGARVNEIDNEGILRSTVPRNPIIEAS